MMTALSITWVILFAFRLALEWLANKYEFFGQWLVISTIALIAVTGVLIISLIVYLFEQFARIRSLLPAKSEAQQEQAQAAHRKRERERGETRSERRARKAARAARRQAYRNKIQRVEAYEKRFWREIEGRK